MSVWTKKDQGKSESKLVVSNVYLTKWPVGSFFLSTFVACFQPNNEWKLHLIVTLARQPQTSAEVCKSDTQSNNDCVLTDNKS